MRPGRKRNNNTYLKSLQTARHPTSSIIDATSSTVLDVSVCPKVTAAIVHIQNSMDQPHFCLFFSSLSWPWRKAEKNKKQKNEYPRWRSWG
ncbi:hypothetical protein BDV30DRAFT_217289 [Aspergillus minisclerotigenes]|uniref:Uncharacterized protein n=1 Tax=Aspergillus minisclerotigenes TaxID=656917 RepID=A0A5N6IS08_9EURO|nr:hypothetical protein BDV30DRAFT_217289 [Aspergillus minisclerotigenes]